MASDLNCHGIKYGINNKTTNQGNNFYVDETFKPLVENYAREARLMHLRIHGPFNKSSDKWLEELKWESKETYDNIIEKATASFYSTILLGTLNGVMSTTT